MISTSNKESVMDGVPEIDLTDPGVLEDPLAAYGRAREQSPVARLMVPGFGPMWAVTRYADAKAMLADPRFQLSPASFMRPAVPEEYLVYLRTMQEMEGAEHLRLRRLVAPAFTPRRIAWFRSRIERIVDGLLDDLPAGGHPVDLLAHFARPLPIEVICELVGIPEIDRAQWREYGAAVAFGSGGPRPVSSTWTRSTRSPAGARARPSPATSPARASSRHCCAAPAPAPRGPSSRRYCST
jgi:cytochrome P450